jgi:predicted HTH domain antitoxin
MVRRLPKEMEMNAGTNLLTIPYPEDLLLSLKESKSDFEAEAKLLLAVKLYEMGRVSTGMAARVAGMDRVRFMFALDRFGLSPIGVDAAELEQDLANA